MSSIDNIHRFTEMAAEALQKPISNSGEADAYQMDQTPLSILVRMFNSDVPFFLTF